MAINKIRSYAHDDCAVVAIQALTNLRRNNISFAVRYAKGYGTSTSKLTHALTALTGRYWIELVPICPPILLGDLAYDFRGIAIVAPDLSATMSHAIAVDKYNTVDNVRGNSSIFDPDQRKKLVLKLIVEEEEQ